MCADSRPNSPGKIGTFYSRSRFAGPSGIGSAARSEDVTENAADRKCFFFYRGRSPRVRSGTTRAPFKEKVRKWSDLPKRPVGTGTASFFASLVTVEPGTTKETGFKPSEGARAGLRDVRRRQVGKRLGDVISETALLG